MSFQISIWPTPWYVIFSEKAEDLSRKALQLRNSNIYTIFRKHIVMLYSLEYKKVFFTSQQGWWRQKFASLKNRTQKSVDLDQSYSQVLTKAAKTSKVIVTVMWSEAIVWTNNNFVLILQ